MRLLQSENVTSDGMASYICFLISIFVFHRFLTKKFGISSIYTIAAIIKIHVKQRLYGLELNEVKCIPRKKYGKL